MSAGPDREPPETASVARLSENLLPRPRTLHALDGRFELADGMAICHDGCLEPPELAALARFRNLCGAQAGVQLDLRVSGRDQPANQILITATHDPHAHAPPPDRTKTGATVFPTTQWNAGAQGYRLRITPARVE